MNLTRREMLRELLLAGLSVTAASTVLAGCGSQSASTDSNSSAATNASASAASTGTASSSGPIRLGFIPLTDCASLVVADQMGYFKKHGVQVEVVKMANWNAVRDQISSNILQGAHCLFGMPFSIASGVSDAKGDPLKIAMTISNNGQGTSLANEFEGKVKYADFAGLGRAVKGMNKPMTFGMTFPGGTHDMWMHLSLAGAGIDPKSVAIKPVPPPQMVGNMKLGQLDGYNVGEPWNGRAVAEKVGFSFIASQDLWQNHPEKALVVNGKFAESRKDDLKKVMMAMIEASQFIDDMKNRSEVAKTIGTKAYVGAEPEVILPRLMGDYPLGGGLGEHKTDHPMQFYRGGDVNFPRHGHGIWFMTAYERWGKAKLPADPMKIARDIILQDLYKEVANEMKIAVPDDDMKPFEVKVDTMTFDPSKPQEMAKMLIAQDAARQKSMA